MKITKIPIRIVQMDVHFLYLPFYYAQRHNFFGYIPNQYKIEKPTLPPIPHTDKNTFKQLIETENFEFAICDPIQILSFEQYSYKPAVLASLVTNSAFWAVDHKTHTVRQFKDIGLYDKIISYAPGTTSYEIAKRLYKLTNKEILETEFIKVVPPNREIEELQDSPKGTIALSPNPLDIEDLIKNGRGQYNIDICLADTSEFQNVLVTSLISKADFVNEHQELITGLLKAIQKALLLIIYSSKNKQDPNAVLTFIQDYFSESKNAEGALKMALNSRVFPSNIGVKKIEWMNSVRANYTDLDESQVIELASNAFEKFIEPYSHMAQKASKEEILPLEKIAALKKTELMRYLEFFGVATLFALTGVFLHSYLISAILVFIYVLWRMILKNFNTPEHKNSKRLHTICCILLSICAIGIIKANDLFPPKRFDTALTTIIAIALFILGFEINTIQKMHNE